MAKFQIENTISGGVLGIYEAETGQEALDIMAVDAGYRDYEEAQTIAPSKVGEILVTKINDSPFSARHQLTQR